MSLSDKLAPAILVVVIMIAIIWANDGKQTAERQNRQLYSTVAGMCDRWGGDDGLHKNEIGPLCKRLREGSWPQ